MPQPSLLNKSFSDGIHKEQGLKKDPVEEISQDHPPREAKATPKFLGLSALIFLITGVGYLGYILYLQLFPKPFIEVSADLIYDGNYSTQKTYNSLTLNEPVMFKNSGLNGEFTITSQNYLVYSPDTYQIFTSSNIDEEVSIASITKLMTALIVMDTYQLNEQITFDGNLPDDFEWTLELEKGESLTIEDLLHAMLMSSYNDAAYLVAVNYLDGGEEGFLKEMNCRTQTYGLQNTHFANSYGYDDPENYSSAMDLMKLTSYFMQNDYLMSIVQKGGASIQINSISGSRQKIIYSTNYLLGRDSRVKGLKTGSTKDAGACFTGYFITTDGDRYVTILLGSEDDRFKETQDMVKYVEDNFK
jgi:D-alanyl-D-alanine carboxypeptidase